MAMTFKVNLKTFASMDIDIELVRTKLLIVGV